MSFAAMVTPSAEWSACFNVSESMPAQIRTADSVEIVKVRDVHGRVIREIPGQEIERGGQSQSKKGCSDDRLHDV
jgi:hypothetical protein